MNEANENERASGRENACAARNTPAVNEANENERANGRNDARAARNAPTEGRANGNKDERVHDRRAAANARLDVSTEGSLIGSHIITCLRGPLLYNQFVLRRAL